MFLFVFRATVVQDNQKYWSDILSDEIKLADISPNTENKDASTNVSKTGDENTSGTGVNPNGADETTSLEFPKNLKDTEKYDLEKSIAETFEGFSGPLESPNEVLLHQGVRQVNKVKESGEEMTKRTQESGIVITPPSLDDSPTAPLPPPRYFYRTMNQFAPDFEPPKRSEFIGQLLQGAMGGGNSAPSSGGGGLGSMMNMMGMASSMLGGGNKGGGGGGGLMSSLGTISKLSGMLGGGNRGQPASSGMGGLRSLGALSSLGSMMGGGGRSPIGAMLGGAGGGGNPGTAPAGGGLGGLGALSSLLGGLGKKNNQSPVQNVAPPPSGAPVNPSTLDEPSLADLLGVDPSVALDTPTVVPAEANPLAGVTAAKAGGGLMAKIGGFAPMLAMAPLALSMFGKKKKQQQQMPFGQPGQFGMPGAPGMLPGSQGQFGMPGAQSSQFGGQGQFGMPGSQGQFGMPPAQQGQFGGMPGQFGMPPQNMGLFGATQPPATQAPKSDEMQQIIQMLEAQRLQIELLKNQIGGASITSQMGGFGNIPLSLGQTTGSQLLGLSDANGLSNLGNFGTSLSTFEPAGPPKQVTQPPQTSSQDILLQELLKQNQMLMQQNQLFQTNMQAASQNQGQFGATAGGSFGRVNRSNGQMMNNGIPSGTLSQNFGQNNFPQNTNNGLSNGFLPGSNTFPNTAPITQGAFGASGQNTFGGMSGNIGGQALQNPSSGAASMFGQFSGSNSGPAAGANGPNFGTMNGGMMSNQGGAAGGGNLASLFGGGAGPAGAGSGTPPAGGHNGMGGQANTPSSTAIGGGGGASNNAPDLGKMMGGIDPSAIQGMLGGGAGGMDMSKLLNNVDVNAMQGLLSGEQGQDLMKSVSGMLSGPNGGNLMQAVSGMMSGESGPGDIANLMGSMDIGELQNMAKQAEGIMASSGIDPAQILGMMG